MSHWLRILTAFACLGVSAASAEDPASTALEAFAAGGELPTLSEPRARVVDLAAGTLVEIEQRHRGRRIIGASAAVRLDSGGRVRWARAREIRDVDQIADKPALTASEAARIVAARVGGYPPGDWTSIAGQARSELVVFASHTAATLAWQIDLPTDLSRRLAARAWVDATTGRILRSQNRVMHASPRGRVFPTNPIVTPTTVEVELTALAEGATTLANADLVVSNCPDTSTCVEAFPQTFLHACQPTPLAVVDAGGDFLAYDFVSDTEPVDEFAEVQAFYHVSRGLAVARSLGGFTGIDNGPLAVVVNFKGLDINSLDDCAGTTTYSGTTELEPFDNALFAPDGIEDGINLGRDALVFGQGTAIDFAYDGDVFYHELGHAVIKAITPELSTGFIDAYGFNPTPAGLHEGYADMLTLFTTNDSTIGEYAASGFGNAVVRELDNQATCPGSLINQRHSDSLVFTGALFEARTAVASTDADRTRFDTAVFTVQNALGASDDFSSAAALTVAEISVAFDQATADTVAAIFEARGLDDCNRRVLDGAISKPFYNLPSGFDAMGDVQPMPAPFQWRYDLQEDAEAIALVIEVFDQFSTAAVDVQVLLKSGDEPILFTNDGGLSHDAEVITQLVVAADRSAQALFETEFPPGPYHIAIVNQSAAASVYQTRVTYAPAAADGCGCSTSPGGIPWGSAFLLIWVLGCLRRSSPTR